MENEVFYLKMNNKWWESYEGQDVVLIEDVGMTHTWMGDFLKIWADRYGFRAEIKNDSTVLRPKKIVVTSNYTPAELWPDKNVHDPILRRFKLRLFPEKPLLKRQNAHDFIKVEDDCYGHESNRQFCRRIETERAIREDPFHPDCHEEPIWIIDSDPEDGDYSPSHGFNDAQDDADITSCSTSEDLSKM